MRTRPPRPGSIVSDIEGYLSERVRAKIADIHASVNARRIDRRLPPVSRESVRGALNSNVGNKGHGLFEREGRGIYSLSSQKGKRPS